MRPILFEIPPLSAPVWAFVLAAFFGLSAYWGVRAAAEETLPGEERRRLVRSALLSNAGMLAAALLLLWVFRDRVARPIPLHAYGAMLMVAFAAGLLSLQRLSRGTRLTPELALDLTLGMLLVSIVCARLLFVLLNWGMYGGNWSELFRIWEGGLSFHGGLIGGILWVIWFTRKHKLGFWPLADQIAPGVALGYAFARIGCFLNGCCYGTPTHLPWAVRFQDPPLSGHWTPPCHPVQLYASFTNLLIFGLLARDFSRKQYDGQVLGRYLIYYSIYRFAAESLRKGVTAEVMALGMTQAQWASLAIAGLGGLLLAYRRRASLKAVAPARKPR